MPFAVTTKRPCRLCDGGTIARRIPGVSGSPCASCAGNATIVVSRSAVATLEEVKISLRKAVHDAAWPSDVGGSNARQSARGQIDDFMVSGGNMIRLPDGTVIEVRDVTWPWLALDAGEPGEARHVAGNWPRSHLDSHRRTVLAAYKVKQEDAFVTRGPR